MDAPARTAEAKRIYRARPTDAEVAELLAMRLVATVGTLNEDGSIHLAYVIFLFEDGRLYLETSSVTRKASNAEARGRATMLIQGQASTGTHLMVAAEGDAAVITGSRAQEINARLRAKYIRPDALGEINQAWGPLDDVAVEIVPRTWRSWTSGPFHEYTQQTLTTEYDDAWI